MDARELELIALNQLMARNRVFGPAEHNDVPSIIKGLSMGLPVSGSNDNDDDDVDVINVNIENNLTPNVSVVEQTVESDEDQNEAHSPEQDPQEETIVPEEPQDQSTEPEKPKTISGKLFQYFKGTNNGQ
jgi:hypothetical protein